MSSPSRVEVGQTSTESSTEVQLAGFNWGSTGVQLAPPAGLARAPAVISDLFLKASGSPSSLPRGRGMRRSQQFARARGSSGSSGMNRDEVRFARAAWPRLIRSSSRPLGGGAAERGAWVGVGVLS